MDLATVGNMPEILRIEKMLLGLEQIECPVKHYLIDGVYLREMFIPAGTVLTGKIHNFESIAILESGTINIANGEESYSLTAPHKFIDKAGIKRLGYAVTDCVFCTIHKVDTDNIEELEKTLVSDTFDQYEHKLMEALS